MTSSRSKTSQRNLLIEMIARFWNTGKETSLTRRSARNHSTGSGADFWGSRAVDSKIVVRVSDETLRRIVEEHLRYKSETGAFWSCQDNVVQHRHVLAQRILPSQQSGFKSFRLLCSVVERITNKSRHPNVASLRAAIEATFADMDRDSLKLTENGDGHSSRRGLYGVNVFFKN